MRNSMMKKFSFFQESIVFKYMDKKHTFSKHIHDEIYMIGSCLEGNSTFTIGDKSYEVSKNHLCIIPPNVVHGCVPDDNGDVWKFFTFYPSKKFLQEMANKMFEEDGDLSFSDYFIDDEELSLILQETVKKTLESEVVNEDEILGFLTLLLEKYGVFTNGIKPIKPEKFDGLLNYLKHEKYDLKELDFFQMAKIVDMNPYYFHRVFSKTVGLTPQSFINFLKVSKATDLLENCESLSLIAQDSGFYDQPHFTKQFKKYYGVTPTNYKKLS